MTSILAVAIALAASSTGSRAAAQQTPLQPAAPPRTQDPGTLELRPTTLDDLLRGESPGEDEFSSTWMRPESFQGFPVFPPSLGGYGQYPAPPGFMQPPPVPTEVPPPLLPEAPDWPAWIQSKRPVDLPYEPHTAVLVRQADRVWWRPPATDPFVPLYHFDFSRGLAVGSEVEVRQTGDFLLLLHGGARIESHGPVQVRIVDLTDTGSRFAIARFTRLELAVFDRGLALELPDGSELIVDPVPAEAPVGTETAPVRLFLDRASEPGRYRGRASIFNAGDRPVRWRTPLGDRVLHPGYRSTFFLTPSAQPLPDTLVEDGVTGSADATRRQWTTPGRGTVTWSGARFEVQGGATLTIDPMLGDPFGGTPAATSSPATAPQRP